MALLLNPDNWPVLGASSRARQTKLEWFSTLGPVAFQEIPLLKIAGERVDFIRCPEMGVRLELHENWDGSFSALSPADTEIDSRINGLTLDDLLLYELDWSQVLQSIQDQFQLTGAVRCLDYNPVCWDIGQCNGARYFFAVLNSPSDLAGALQFIQETPEARLMLPSVSDRLYAALLKQGIQFHALDSGEPPEFPDEAKGATSLYRIVRQSKGWKIIYNGSEAFLGQQKGMFIVEYLLKNPPAAPIHALKLEAVVFSSEGDVYALGDIKDSTDDDDAAFNISSESSGFNLNEDNAAVRADIVDSIKKLQRDVAAPEISEKRKKEILDQIREAQAYLQAGDPKQKDHASAAQARINKQLTRLLAALREPDRATRKPSKTLSEFADHIENRLLIPSRQFSGTSTSRVRAGVAQTFTYEPQPDVIWTD